MNWIVTAAALIACAGGATGQPVIRTFDASPKAISAGGSAKLTWAVEKAGQVTIEPGIGVVSSKSSVVVKPAATTTYTLTAVNRAGTMPVTMEVIITVVPVAGTSPAQEMGLATGFWLLPPELQEDPGFGLYSYLLLAETEGPGNRARYLAVLEEVVRQVSWIEDLVRRTKRKEDLKLLNVLHIPVRLRMDPGSSAPGNAARRILDNYDYARARILLTSVGGEHLKGPYFVSRLEPISIGRTIQRPYLWQDMSGAAPSLAAEWVKRFLGRAARDDPWKEGMMATFALGIRNDIEVLASIVMPVSWVSGQ